MHYQPILVTSTTTVAKADAPFLLRTVVPPSNIGKTCTPFKRQVTSGCYQKHNFLLVSKSSNEKGR